MSRATIIVLVACLLGAGDDKPEAKWVDTRIQVKVRERMSTLIGQSMPRPPDSVQWIGDEKPTFQPGQIVVIQSIGASGGKALLERIRKSLPQDVLLVAVHSSKKADRVEREFAQKRPCPIGIDTDGLWVAALDLPETPTNVLVDSTGKVLHVCLRTDALKPAAEAAERAAQAPMSGAGAIGTTPLPVANKAFPTPSGAIQSATDRRGQKMPEFTVEQWITDRPPAPEGKLLVIDFWATWCGPCVASIPHMNQLATKFGDIAQFVGVSNEQPDAFAQGMIKIGKTPKDFRYALALSPSGTMSSYFGIRGIPHCVIVSGDGVVRWQGHPGELSEDVFQRYADAQRSLNAANPPSTGKNPPGGTRKY
jgi:thiol-disulfide isomerase/thioredoxin